MTWLFLYELTYLLVLLAVCGRIIYDTNSTVKTLAYLMLAIFIPFAGMIFYFSFGINYRKRQLYTKKLIEDDATWKKIKQNIVAGSKDTFWKTDEELRPDRRLARFLSGEMSALTTGNKVRLLLNGEEKFPAVIEALEQAKEHIHIEYYIYENDKIGRIIEELLIRKVKEGITVRFIYDDFGSRGIRKNIARRLREEGVQAYPFYKIVFIKLANRLNYRNHRKIIIIDGKQAFVGGINISDRYINDPAFPAKDKIYWRDTHLMLEGPGVHYLQYLFICDWNFCVGTYLDNLPQYFPVVKQNQIPGDQLSEHLLPGNQLPGDQLVQIAASGPDSTIPTILYTLLFAIHQAEKEVLITTPYFIPELSITDAIRAIALGGVTVKLLVPERSDSKLVGLAARSYYDDLLSAGVQLYFYKKGFVHAKTVVVDRKLSIVGTANMDYRSFDLNFEVNAIVYDEDFASNLVAAFEQDLQDSIRVEPAAWFDRPVYKRFLEKTARLVSPLL